jgi:hypothetical protein
MRDTCFPGRCGEIIRKKFIDNGIKAVAEILFCFEDDKKI